jgi:hypothetical protein
MEDAADRLARERLPAERRQLATAVLISVTAVVS